MTLSFMIFLPARTPLPRLPLTLRLTRAMHVAALTALFMAAGLSQAEARRLALVVGNADYAAAPKLRNAGGDAEAMARSLERLGFEVTLLRDLRTGDFWARVEDFARAAEGAESTVFYYAGHAFQMSGVNYLVPVDATLASREALRAETWSLDAVIARIQDRRRQTLVFLDACRNDPLPASVRGSTAADGLARVQTGVGTFVAFATEPGAVTYDGAGDAPHSPFATALMSTIETPGLSVSDMMIRVRNEVSEATMGRQVPWDQSSLREQFYFKAETATRQELSEADYELLAQLSPEDRAKFLDLLRASGFSEESLRQADDAITVASYNLEVAAEAEVTIGAADAAIPAGAPAETGIELSQLEVIDSGVTIGGAPGSAAASGTADATAPLALAETATAPGPAAVAPAAGAAPADTVAALGAAQPPATATGTGAADAPGPAAGAGGPSEPPVVVASVETAPALPAGTAAGVQTATAPLPEALAAALPRPESLPALGLPVLGAEPAGPPVRLAALTWATRGILELNAVGDDRTRLPGAEVLPDSDANRALLAAIDPALVGGEGAPAADPRTLARDVQGELARLGCYRMAVDGNWGKGSRTALTSYFLARRSVPDSLEPSPALLDQLRRDTQVVCEVQVARARVVAGKTRPILAAAETGGGATVRVRPSAGRTAVTVDTAKKNISRNLTGMGFN